MKYYQIEGLNKLEGKIEVENSKNAILPILCATVLTNEEIVIKNVPKFSDVYAVIDILSHLGKIVLFQNNNLIISGEINKIEIPEHLCERLRASIFFLGPIISRLRKCTIFYPGGCNLGARPIDYHVNCLNSLGAKVFQENNKISFNCENMRCGIINLPFASVGATINSILASVFLHGETFITNAAKEPEIVDLCEFLNKCGAKIFGMGSSVIRVVGVNKLHGCEYTPIPDRIVAGSYLLMAAATRSKVEICNFRAVHNIPLLKKLLECGCSYLKKCDTIYLKNTNNLTGFGKVVADVYPNFPTDLQPLILCSALSLKTESIVTDNVFRDRFNYVKELKKMNANIQVFGNCAKVKPSRLLGNKVFATDLRAGAGLILAGLNAKGTTQIYNTHYIERGYENIVEKLKGVGVNIAEKEE